jgi:high-affinity K+ transport system ATPase subunit B
MRVRTFSVLFVVMAIYFVIAVAAEVFIDDYVKPQSVFAYLLVSTLVTGIATLGIKIDIPN